LQFDSQARLRVGNENCDAVQVGHSLDEAQPEAAAGHGGAID
jgi:hypothetical protein